MKIDVLTLFPEMFEPLKASILGKAMNKGVLTVNLINIRDFSKEKHKKTDDYPYSGGDGMVMTPQPLYDAIMSVKTEQSYVVYLSPKGTPLKQNKVKELAKLEHMVLVCGHYEGIDERIITLLVNEQISIGDFVLTGGEIPAMALIDSVSRYITGVLGNANSTEVESFSDQLLEYPQYTRPQTFMGLEVPSVLLSGNHKNIDAWKQQMRLEETKRYRPDLLNKNQTEQ